ncbi:MAG: TerC family protein [Kineosporiaceae bacterium]|nr:TerC family protein [Kineosporiaceae bacterium]MBK7624971.1 TerC family protein [Kineosporiaceae bacterium]
MSLWFEVTTFAVLAVLLIADLVLVARSSRVPSMRECTAWVGFYVGLALVFALILLGVAGTQEAGQFLAGWLTEYSLSVDNLFVFVVIMSRFSVPRHHQQEVLMVGIILSLVLRGGFIVVGAAAIERFSWMFYLFGAFLIYTAIQLARQGETEESDFEENILIRKARRVLPIAPTYDGRKLLVTFGGTKALTPMVLVFLAIATTDVLFALDSIPAIFGLTQDPFIVYTATIFALMGLRQLYFLLGGLLDRLVYLSIGLAVVLGFIGVKLVLEALHLNEVGWINGGQSVGWAPEIPIWVSLSVIVAVLTVTTVASLAHSRRHEALKARDQAGDQS